MGKDENSFKADTAIYDDLKARGHILFETVIGSQAHGTATPKSDVDTSFVYMAPQEWLYVRSDYRELLQLSKDRVGYELEHFLNLVATKNNPTCLENLFSPEDCWILKNVPIYDIIQGQRTKLLSKVAKSSYFGYAAAQIRKAKGMEKFQNWSAERTTRKEPLDFCWVVSNKKGYDTIPLRQFMEERGLSPNDLGVSSVTHAPNVFSLFHGEMFRGIFGENSDQILFSSIPKEMESIGLMSYNKDAYKVHTTDWKRYTDWKKNANRDRWVETKNGEFIDAKNIMHLVRLIQMNKEIATGHGCVVRRPNRDELLAIRNGERNLDDIIAWRENEEKEITELYAKSDLPDKTDMEFVKQTLMRMREEFYGTPLSSHLINIEHYDCPFLPDP